MELSASFVEETHSLNVTFFTMLEKDRRMKEKQRRNAIFFTMLKKDRSMKKTKKEIIRTLINPIVSFVPRQHAWFSHPHGKTSRNGDSLYVRRDIGVGGTPHSQSRRSDSRTRRRWYQSPDQKGRLPIKIGRILVRSRFEE